MRISDLSPNKRNPRKASKDKLKLLKNSLEALGDLGGIIFNRRSQTLVGGHQRVSTVESNTEINIEYTFDPPTNHGTVAEGFILINGERHKYREVDWDDITETQAKIAANNSAGKWDMTLLHEDLLFLDHNNADLDLTMFTDQEIQHQMGGFEAVEVDLKIGFKLELEFQNEEQQQEAFNKLSTDGYNVKVVNI